jgi:hypothetical protein
MCQTSSGLITPLQDAVGIAAVRHRSGEPPANAKPALSLPQQQQARVGGLIAAVEINCEVLAADGWQENISLPALSYSLERLYSDAQSS